ncbi:MAG: hypothetical protein R3282_00255 [Rhodothermales bacterium]|nr:hypothetical protein [Rhodothermales bacterium]
MTHNTRDYVGVEDSFGIGIMTNRIACDIGIGDEADRRLQPRNAFRAHFMEDSDVRIDIPALLVLDAATRPCSMTPEALAAIPGPRGEALRHCAEKDAMEGGIDLQMLTPTADRSSISCGGPTLSEHREPATTLGQDLEIGNQPGFFHSRHRRLLRLRYAVRFIPTVLVQER